ncbi:TnsA-like heteromeric transposase endonuclease subunit [Gordonia sp. UBA7599]|uniref:TnsA-like heteromeric transposase endonuclease subunit n=1 Tax=unclassified Gordonia (in: high G+C Gram-positive bacteria) TaxID=2657482 RepID=UPI0025B7BE2F|nr:TnsA-like heteromeric transposase endonuclease subunit [Gordonia sp. UBA7599]HNP56216.1 TnsA-like heteromeric transposase endonuclease subunit [Gordonia sp. (in: high G+C Gram-positive bacteria)]
MTWIVKDGQVRTESASPLLLEEAISAARPYRQGVQYQNRLNRHSRHFMATQKAHVWCESALEADALLTLEFEGRIARIAAQPMLIEFSDGRKHIPDFFAELKNGDQIVYDVKPADRMAGGVNEQFELTAVVCSQIGWRHAVLNETPVAKLRNLQLLRAARHRQYHPPPHDLERLRDAFVDGRCFQDGATMVNLRHPYLAAAHVRHLIWHHHLSADLDVPLSTETFLRWIRKESQCDCGA